jgi:Uma2 family endonuclease
MNQIAMPLPGTAIDPHYPDSDGRFMGETDYHNESIIQIRQDLEDYFADVDTVYVASNIVMYFKRGDAKARKDPDVLVAKGVKGNHKRRSYRVWEEKKIPQVLFEISSRRTWRVDVGEKRELYAQIGVKEYFVFDSENRYLNPPLQGFRSMHGKSIPMEWTNGVLVSKQLGLNLTTDGEMLRFIDAKTGARLLTRRECIQREQLRADLEKERAELEKTRADGEKARAEFATGRAEFEKERAEFEERRANEMAAEVAKLKARLAELEP